MWQGMEWTVDDDDEVVIVMAVWGGAGYLICLTLLVEVEVEEQGHVPSRPLPSTPFLALSVSFRIRTLMSRREGYNPIREPFLPEALRIFLPCGRGANCARGKGSWSSERGP